MAAVLITLLRRFAPRNDTSSDEKKERIVISSLTLYGTKQRYLSNIFVHSYFLRLFQSPL